MVTQLRAGVPDAPGSRVYLLERDRADLHEGERVDDTTGVPYPVRSCRRLKVVTATASSRVASMMSTWWVSRV